MYDNDVIHNDVIHSFFAFLTGLELRLGCIHLGDLDLGLGFWLRFWVGLTTFLHEMVLGMYIIYNRNREANNKIKNRARQGLARAKR